MWLMEYKEKFLFSQLSYTNWTRQTAQNFQECIFQIMVETAVEGVEAERGKDKSIISFQL